ncbi:hypothetical protein [Neobacillus soli]|uniref:hypothetical protein n=1 Tax=Neobacillus soli TaxID=220688 RepID=UPI000AAE920D|nr:hypothetical protein [Neobacillus soli]
MPVLLINVPSRYAHTPTSMIHYDDYINTVQLMTEVIKRLNRKTVVHWCSGKAFYLWILFAIRWGFT